MEFLIIPSKVVPETKSNETVVDTLENCLFDFLDWFSFGLLNKTSNIEI